MVDALSTGQIAYDQAAATSAVDAASRGAGSKNLTELKNACRDFEAIFIKMMLDAMRKTLSDDTLIPKNSGEKLFEDQLYQEYANSMSKTANLGIADMMYKQLESALPGGTVKIDG